MHKMKSHKKVMIVAGLLTSLMALALSAPADSNSSQQQQQAIAATASQTQTQTQMQTQTQEQQQQQQQQAAVAAQNLDNHLQQQQQQQQQQTQALSSNSISGQMVLPPPPPPPTAPLSVPQFAPQPMMSAPMMANHHHALMQAAQQPVRLPKINIFLSKNEVYKLLGLGDTTIHYVTNGQVNSYPLGFTVPMGYGMSDMIFTWQNLGQTNVNYSISLVISNIQAVELPIINITRSGLIPRHEQVFKITLPCSGKVTDDADVQVLINISGLVPVGSGGEHELAAADDLGAALDANGAAAEPGAYHKLARAVQQQSELLAAAAAAAANAASASTASGNASQQPGGEQMQADQQQQQVAAADSKRPQAQMRMVSHTLAIKRRKICTVAPVPVQPAPWPARPANEVVRPPNQPPSQVPSAGVTNPSQLVAESSQKSNSQPPGGKQQLSEKSTSGSGNGNGQQFQSTTTPEPVAEPAHQPTWTSVGNTPTASDLPPGTTSSVPPAPFVAGRRISPKVQQQPTSGGDVVASSWLRPSGGNSNGGGLLQASPNPILDLLPRTDNSAAGSAQQAVGGSSGGNSPLLFTLIVMSLVISFALVALLILGQSSSTSSSRSYGRQTPLDKFRALTNCIWSRTSAGSRAVNKCTKHVGPITIKNGIIGTFGTSNHLQHQHGGPSSLATAANTLGRTVGRPNTMLHGATKSTVDSLSGLSTISGHQQQQQHSGSSKLHTQNANLNSLMGPYYYKQQQQQQPVGNYAGYFGGSHHYQQALDNLLIGPTSTTSDSAATGNNSSIFHGAPSASPYHITMSNSQTTKLYLGGGSSGNAGHGGMTNNHNSLEQANYTIDNSYMPISATTTTSRGIAGYPQPYTDSGSVYQTIN